LAAESLAAAKRPVIFIGGGVNLSDTSAELRKLIEITGLPAFSSLMGLGCLPADCPEHLGMVGMHGTYAANMSTMECDLLLGIGVRFDDRVTSLIKDFAPHAKIVHFDIDPAEVNKNVRAHLRVLGDLRWSLPLLCQHVSLRSPREWRAGIAEWTERIEMWKQKNSAASRQTTVGIKPQTVIEETSRLTQNNSVIVTDVGQHQMWTAQYYQFQRPRSFLTSGGLGTMGYGLPAALGAQLSLPDKTVVLFTGDGSIMMNCQELATVADLGLPIKIIVLNNQVLGMVNQWQRMFYGRRYSHSTTKGHTDLVKLAEAMGVAGLRVTEPEQLVSALEQALHMPGPVLVEIMVPSDEDVLPMVPPGGRLDKMLLGGEN